jgi:hypothetical protein
MYWCLMGSKCTIVTSNTNVVIAMAMVLHVHYTNIVYSVG